MGIASTGRANEDSAQAAEIAPLAVRSLLLDGHRAGDLLAVSGERGHILTSHDGGHEWTQQAVPTRATLTAIHFANESLGWAAGHDATILRTTDGGVHWTLVYQDIEDDRPILDMWFRDAQHGFAVGAYGLLLRTRDGGLNWTKGTINPDEDFHLNAIGPLPDERLFIVGEAGAIYRSTDIEGREWLRLESPYEGSWFGFQSLGDGHLLIYGLRGHLFRSNDSGEHWQQINTGTTAMLTDSILLDNGDLIIAGLGGNLLRSKDGGISFMPEQFADRKGIEALLQSASGLLRLGEGGIRRINSDAGQRERAGQ